MTGSLNMTGTFKAIIAGGGTGGHIFPGIAVAKELEKRFEQVHILFIVGRRKMESEILSHYGYPIESIYVEGLKGRGLKKGLSVILMLPICLLQSLSVINKFSPHVVLGVGGYSSGPFCLAAKFKKIPTAIHEQNSYPGLTNRLLSGMVDQIFLSFEESREFLKGKTKILTGNPVREELIKGKKDAAQKKHFTILVVGGSQGAMAVNKVFSEALQLLNNAGKFPHVIHQTGENDYSRVKADYEKKRIKGELSPFIHDMATAYHQSDLVVGRAGATTIFELTALGKPSILVPYPFASNNHQETNARSLMTKGGAEMILQKELNGEGLAKVVEKYMDDRAGLEKMAKCAEKAAMKNAAKDIVDHMLKMSSRCGMT